MGYYIDYRKMQDYVYQVRGWIGKMIDLLRNVYREWEEILNNVQMKGVAAEVLKAYIAEVHIPIVKALCMLLKEHIDKLEAYVHDYYMNVDASPETILSEDLLIGCEEKLKTGMQSLKQMHQEIEAVLRDVRYICDIKEPEIEPIEENTYHMVQLIRQTNENVAAVEDRHVVEVEELEKFCMSLEKMILYVASNSKLRMGGYKNRSIKSTVEYIQLEENYKKREELKQVAGVHAEAVLSISKKVDDMDKIAVQGAIQGAVRLLNHIEQEEETMIPVMPERESDEGSNVELDNDIVENGKITGLSNEAVELLRELELADYQLVDVAVYDVEGKLIGMMPYYVMTGSSAPFQSDGGITIGYGHHINIDEWNDSNNPDHILLAQYIPEDMEVTYITADYEMMTRSGLIAVPEAEMISIDVIEELFIQDIEELSRKIKEYLDSMGIEVSQNEFDALVIYRYNRGHLSDTVMTYLEEGNRNEEDWLAVWTGGNNRKEACQRLFFGEEP